MDRDGRSDNCQISSSVLAPCMGSVQAALQLNGFLYVFLDSNGVLER